MAFGIMADPRFGPLLVFGLAPAEPAEPSAGIPNYRGLIYVPDGDSADQRN